MLASDPFATINGDSVICINVTQTHSYMLEVGIPFCKTRPASVVPDHKPVLGEQEQKSCSSFRHFVSSFLVKNYERGERARLKR